MEGFGKSGALRRHIGGRANNKPYLHYEDLLYFYNEVPTEDVSLDELRELAITRLEVLRQIEVLSVKHSDKYLDFVSAISKLLDDKHLYKPYDNAQDDRYEKTRRDVISHYALRSAYCRNEELKRWFVAQELELFKARFKQMQLLRLEHERETQIKHMEKSFHGMIRRERVKKEERQKYGQQLNDAYLSSRAVSPRDGKNSAPTDYYTVPWTEVIDLVKKREVFVMGGKAYIHQNQFLSMLTSAFRHHLNERLAANKRRQPLIDADPRLGPFLKSLPSMFVGPKAQHELEGETALTLENIHAMAKRSFPACMKNLFDQLSRDHHLRYFGRQQLTLFLKGAGLSMEDSLQFWKGELGKKVGDDRFQKEYAYNIRHAYGKEGKRTDYSPYHCRFIVSKVPPQQGDHHGCPFYHMDIEDLSVFLSREYGLKDGSLAKVKMLDERKAGRPEVGCKALFDALHPSSEYSDEVGNHPNTYFKCSVRHFEKVDKHNGGSSGSGYMKEKPPKEDADMMK